MDTQQFKKVIEDIVDVKLNQKGITKFVSAIVSNVNSDGSVDVYLPPNNDVSIENVLNKTGESLSEGDSVELCTKNGKIQNAWVAIKHETNFLIGGCTATFDDDITFTYPSSAWQPEKVNMEYFKDNSSPSIFNIYNGGVRVNTGGYYAISAVLNMDNMSLSSIIININSAGQYIVDYSLSGMESMVYPNLVVKLNAGDTVYLYTRSQIPNNQVLCRGSRTFLTLVKL